MPNVSESHKKLIDRGVDDDLSDDEHAELQAILKNDKAAREHYYEQCALASMLNFEAQTASASPLPQPAAAPKSIIQFPTIVKLITVAALVALAFVIGTKRNAPARELSQQVQQQPTQNTVNPTQEGTMEQLAIERSQFLESGVLRMDFPGVRLAIAGPAEFKRRSTSELELTSGTLIARVQPESIGFTVSTPAATVVDLGTVFGVTVGHDQQTETHVFEGKVAVSATDADTVDLEKGEALKVWRHEAGPLLKATADLNEFRSLIPYATDIIDGISDFQAPSLRIPDPVFGTQIGRWTPNTLMREPTIREWDVTQLVNNTEHQLLEINFPKQYESLATVHSIELMQNNMAIASFRPPAKNLDRFSVRFGVTARLFVSAPLAADTPVYLRATLSSRAPRSDSGMIWLKSVSIPATLQPSGEEWKGNLALNKKATADSHEGSKLPERCVDGRLNDDRGWWASPLPQHITVDIGRTTNINRIHAHLYASRLRYYQYRIEASADGQDWTTVVDMSNSTLLASLDGEPHQFPAIEARYIRFQFLLNSANDAGHLAELQIYPAD